MIPVVRCPKCNKRQKIIENSISCEKGHFYDIDEDVLVLAPDFKIDKKYEWDKNIRDPKENKRLDQTESPLANKDSRRKMEDMIKYIVNNVPKKTSTMLDIVTGRGLLIRKVLPIIHNSNVFLNDISADVLVGTYKLITPLIGTNKVFPIQTSTTQLPFNDNSLPLIISFGPNNIHKPDKGFKEIFRVLKKGGLFIFSNSLVEKGSPSYNHALKESGGFADIELIDNWRKSVKDIGFKILDETVLFDGPVNKVPLDIYPIEDGERNQNVGAILTK